MIEFKGNISKKCRRFIKTMEARNSMIGALTATIMVTIPVVIYVGIWQPWSLFLTIPWMFLFPTLCYVCTKIDDFVPLRIVISKDGTIKSECKETTVMENISNVKKVKDYGDFYYIAFGKLIGGGRFVCQKDLLTKGTLEEFEETFGEKMSPKKREKVSGYTMIRFDGQMSEACKRYVLKKSLRSKAFRAAMCLVLGLPAAFGIARIVSTWTLLISLPSVALMFCLAFLFPKPVIHMPHYVEISDNDTIIRTYEKMQERCSVNEVKRVIDFGEWCEVSYATPKGAGWFVFHKHMIKNGTVEDFEKLFMGKIIRKIDM